jgi:monoamine oxidase
MQKLLEQCHPSCLTLRLGTPVASIKWSRRSVEVLTQSGETMRASGAVITLPLGVLRAGDVRFDPPLPDKADAVARLEVGPVVRVVLHFREPFWETGSSFPTVPRGQTLDDLSFFHGPLEVFPTWWTHLPMRIPRLTAWSGGPAAERLHGMSDAEIVSAALASLCRMLGTSGGFVRDRLVSSHAVDWQADPFARGAYSYLPVGGLDAMQRLAEPVKDTLFFAGEATHHEGQSGTVGGALATGYRAAREFRSSQR